MTEPEALLARRQSLLEILARAADEIKMIDDQLEEFYMNDMIQKDDHRFDGTDPDGGEA